MCWPSWNMETSGLIQTCTGIALPFLFLSVAVSFSQIWTYCIHMDILYTYGHTVYIWTYCIHMDILYTYGHILYIWTYCIHMDIFYTYGHTVYIWTYYIHMDILYTYRFTTLVYTQITYCWNIRVCSWIKRDQLDVTCFFISLFSAQHVSDVSTSILRSLRLICWIMSWAVLLWYDVCTRAIQPMK